MVVRASATLSQEAKSGNALTKNRKKLTISTPAGNLVFWTTGDDIYDSPNALLLLDTAGNDEYNGTVAASSSLKNCVSVCIDLSGDDYYNSADGQAQGCGILGTGVLLDMNGNDVYDAERLSQGCCLVGTGVFFDADGNDKYYCHVTGQASGFYGLTVLADITGDDSYNAYGFAQASAGNRCMAHLVDIKGDDKYFVEPDVVLGYEGLDYGESHEGKNGNASQGCGWGQRAITSPENNGIAGGIAGMIDFDGDDNYISALWTVGAGYWGGIGFVVNLNGNDKYNTYYYSQASVAHYGIGALVDIGGNDAYYLENGAGFSLVWDRGISLLVDDGGNDVYLSHIISGGSAMSAYDPKGIDNQDLTYAFFVDVSGNDYYSVGAEECYGYGRGGYFIDAGGNDDYHWIIENDTMTYGQDFQKGGVFIDYCPDEEKRLIPQLKFYENTKEKYGFLLGCVIFKIY